MYRLLTAPLLCLALASPATALSEKTPDAAKPSAAKESTNPVLHEETRNDVKLKVDHHGVIHSIYIRQPDDSFAWQPFSQEAFLLARSGKTKALKALLDKGLSPNVNGSELTSYPSPILYRAVDHADTVKLLLDRGADVTIVTYNQHGKGDFHLTLNKEIAYTRNFIATLEQKQADLQKQATGANKQAMTEELEEAEANMKQQMEHLSNLLKTKAVFKEYLLKKSKKTAKK